MTRWRFIHIPKTAGESVARAYGRGTEHGHPHLPATVFAPDVHLFTVIREPFDRAVSICAYLFATLLRDLEPANFHAWVEGGCHHDHHGADGLIIVSWRGPDGLRITSPQRRWLDGRVTALCFEQIDIQLPAYMQSLGVEPQPLPHANASRRLKQLARYDDPGTMRRLEDLYWLDFELWSKVASKGYRHGS
jgi:hypothetical protein